ncbi:cysteine desulfurase [Candidatus Beckwithbacteria bacterium RIFCSPHIGHO2_12_FULL_49_13]|nr:MAG: cysteine desulfurase [Candidatus Beckwithbacteria bacterium RIFCSPHIGHO2_12_FULL_49_13]
MLDVNKIKKDFPILSRKVNGKRLVYLDNAATSQKPKAVIEAEVEFYRRHNANVHRGLHSLCEAATVIYEEARKTVAGFIGGEADELVFVRNATEGLNLVAWAWAAASLKRGDEILTSVIEHHSNLIPWQRLSRAKGLKLVVAGVAENGVLDMADFANKLTRKTKLVAIGHMSNTTGAINPVAKIVKMAKRVRARVAVDAAQSVPHLKVNFKDLGVDFLAFSGHKMLGPMGIGGVLIKKERQEEMEPFLTGGGMISEVWPQRATWAAGVEKFEAGTPNVAGAVGLAAAVEYLTKLGMARVYEHEKKMVAYALKRLGEIEGLRVIGPKTTESRGGVISFVMEGVHAHDIAQVLSSEGVAVRSGHHCTMPLHKRLKLAATTRASFYIYNDKKDVDALIDGLKKVKNVFT